MPNTYSIGDLIQLTATFTTVATGANINPTTVTFTIRKPDGTQTSPSVTNPSTGVYQTQVSIDQPGTWRWRAVGTGAAQAAMDSAFQVTPNTF